VEDVEEPEYPHSLSRRPSTSLTARIPSSHTSGNEDQSSFYHLLPEPQPKHELFSSTRDKSVSPLSAQALGSFSHPTSFPLIALAPDGHEMVIAPRIQSPVTVPSFTGSHIQPPQCGEVLPRVYARRNRCVFYYSFYTLAHAINSCIGLI